MHPEPRRHVNIGSAENEWGSAENEWGQVWGRKTSPRPLVLLWSSTSPPTPFIGWAMSGGKHEVERPHRPHLLSGGQKGSRTSQGPCHTQEVTLQHDLKLVMFNHVGNSKSPFLIFNIKRMKVLRKDTGWFAKKQYLWGNNTRNNQYS